MVDFCKSYLVANREAFCDPRLELVINDARLLSLPPHSLLMFLTETMTMVLLNLDFICFGELQSRAREERRVF